MEETHLTMLSAMRRFFFFDYCYSLISTLGSAASRVKEKQNNAERGAIHRHWYEVTDCLLYNRKFSR